MKNDPVSLRQQRLIARSGQLRNSISDQAQVFKSPLAFVDKLHSALGWLYCHPAWPLGTIFSLLVLKPKRAIVWGTRLWAAWKTFKRLETLLVNSQKQR